MAEPTSFLSAGLIYKSVAAGVAKVAGQEGSKKLYRYVTTRLKDGSIPANHDLQKAVEEALVEAARAFALGVAAQLGEKPPLFEAMRAHFSEGKFEARLTELRRVSGKAWVKELLEEAKPGKDGKRGIAADFVIAEGNLTKLLAETQSGGSELEKRVTKAFAQWLERHVQGAERPGCVDEFLKQGWPLEKGGAKRVTFYEAFVLFFREKIKDVPVVRDIFLAQTTSGIAEDVKKLLAQAKPTDEGLRQWLAGEMGGLKDWLEPKLDKLQASADRTSRGLHKANKRLRTVKAGVVTANAGIAGVAEEVRSLPQKILQGAPLLEYKKRLYDRFSPHRVIGLGANEPNKQKADKDSITDLFVLPTCSESWLTPNAVEEAVRKGETAKSTALLPRLVEERAVVLLADPGMGKSTLIQWLVVALTKKGAPPAEAVPFGKKVPFPIILRDVMPHLQRLHPDPQDWSWQRLLDVFLDCYQPDGFTEPLARPLRAEGFDLNEVLDSANAWFLIDGLDEVGSVPQRQALREALWQGFLAHPQASWLVTSRVVGYAEAEVHVGVIPATGRPQIADVLRRKALPSPTFPGNSSFKIQVGMAKLLYLAPWDNEQQETFARHWFIRRKGNLEGPPFGEEFIRAVRSHPGTAVIGRVPNVLLLMALFYRYRAFLPHGRAKVYQGISEAYLENIAVTAHIDHRKTEMELKQKERLLAIVAMHLQLKREQQSPGDGHEAGDILASEEELKTWLCGEFGAKDDPKAVAAMKAFIDHIADSSGILLPRGLGSYAFTHLSFQEYYAACWLELEFRRLLNEGKRSGGSALFGTAAPIVQPVDEVLMMDEAKFAKRADETIWHEPLLFLAEKLGNENDVQTLMGWLFPWDEGRSPPLLREAAKLLATFSVDQQVELPDSLRKGLWSRLWEAWIKAQRAFEPDCVTDAWGIESILLGAHPYFIQVQEALAPHLGKARGLTFVDCTRLGELKVLPATPQLVHLTIYDAGPCKDLHWAKGLSGLQTVQLWECHGLTDLDALEQCGQLAHVEIFSCPSVTSFEALVKDRHMKKLFLQECPGIEKLEALTRVKSLKAVRLAGISSRDLSPLLRVPGLEEIELIGWTDREAVESLASLETLKTLKLRMGSLGRSNGLSGFVHLESLTLVEMEAGDLTALEGLTNLRFLRFYQCANVTEAAVEALRKALPQCEIVWDEV